MKKYVFVTIIFVMVALTTVKGQYASLAIDQRAGERYGWAVNYETQSDADQRALSECEKNGGNCHIVLRFEGGCGVYVVERGNNSLYGWGTGNTRAEAESRAMHEARMRGGKDLIVRVWGCNGSNLVRAEEGDELLKGVFYFHYTYSSDWKRFFITDILYAPFSAEKSGDKWLWTSDAASRLTPGAEKFMDIVEENIYGFLGDNKDKAYTRTGLDWEGTNEVKYDNKAIDLNLTDRKKRIEGGAQAIIEDMKNAGYEIIKVDIGR